MVVAPNWDAVVAIIIPNVVGIACGISLIGQVANKDGTAWFQKLKKPSWAVKAWVYGPIDVILYTCLGYASYLVYSESAAGNEKTDFYATVLYAAQLLLSLTFCFSFYKFHKISFAFFVLLVLDGTTLALTVAFYNINSYAPIFMIPAQLWQTYATLLVHAVWVLNDKQPEDCQNLKV